MAAQITERGDAEASSGRPQQPAGDAAALDRDAGVRHVRSVELFGASREVVIQHDHHVYRLKQTSRGGLILTK